METTIHYQIPGDDYWERYARLWKKSLHLSPFQSPHLLQYLTSLPHDGLLVFECTDGDQLLASTIFKREKDYYIFLSDMKTDANFFVIHESCSPYIVRQIFKCLLDTIYKNNIQLMLNHLPAWASYADTLESLVQNSALYYVKIDYSVCPVAMGDAPKDLFNEVNASRNTRYKVNKFLKQDGEAEVITDDEDMSFWVQEFCDAHVARWAPTPTPSVYRHPPRRRHLEECLRAWNADHVLVRFALRVNGKRIAFTVGLLEGEKLIYHAPTFHPDYAECSPGRVLIYYITQWMAENNMRILDFGDGNEAYKYYTASQDQVLRRIFISRKYNISFIARTQFIKAVRTNQALFKLYQHKFKPIYQSLLSRTFGAYSLFVTHAQEFAALQEEYFISDIL